MYSEHFLRVYNVVFLSVYSMPVYHNIMYILYHDVFLCCIFTVRILMYFMLYTIQIQRCILLYFPYFGAVFGIINIMFNDVNLMHIPAKDMCAYGRGLLDVVFSKEEQARSVLLQSSKPPLSPRRVQLLFGKFCEEGMRSTYIEMMLWRVLWGVGGMRRELQATLGSK